RQTASCRPPTVRPWIVVSNSPPNGSFPTTQNRNGPSSEKVLGGHSTNFAKLYRNAAFTSYSLAPGDWPVATCAAINQINAIRKTFRILKSAVLQKCTVIFSRKFRPSCTNGGSRSCPAGKAYLLSKRL